VRWHGATAHKELAWLSLLKRSRHFENTIAAFGQKRIDAEMDARSDPGRDLIARKNRAGFTLPGFDF
jgi:hypothetical protein